MSSIMIFLYEWKHLLRSPFKVVALLLFVLASGYGLHNGASLYKSQMAEVESIQSTSEEDRAEYIAIYDAGQTGPEERPWINISEPFWAIWYANIYHIKTPSPAMVYSIGQAEQYGFYKRVTFMASPYDADMAEEIANPERLQMGTMDFSFSLLFLLPLVLLILLYNLKGEEAERGFLPLIEVQATSHAKWLLARVLFYLSLLAGIVLLMTAYGAFLTNAWATAGSAIGQIALISLVYLLFWGILFSLILLRGTTIMGNTLSMVGSWLVITLIIPAGVHQWISIEQPADLMTDFIDVSRDGKWDLYDQPDSVSLSQLYTLFPEIENSPVAQDSAATKGALNDSFTALINELLKKSIDEIEGGHEVRNRLVRKSFAFNPLSFFQNQLNTAARTHYHDYKVYREELQFLIDRQIQLLVVDTWNQVEVDKKRYLAYPTLMGSHE